MGTSVLLEVQLLFNLLGSFGIASIMHHHLMCLMLDWTAHHMYIE